MSKLERLKTIDPEAAQLVEELYELLIGSGQLELRVPNKLLEYCNGTNL